VAATGDGRRIFLSYADADEPWAAWVAYRLNQAGYSPRLAAWHATGGPLAWSRDELAAAACVMVVLSPSYLGSSWARGELDVALAGAAEGRLLVAVRVEPCETPASLRGTARISLVDRSEDDAAETLLAGLLAAADGERTAPLLAPPAPPGRPPAGRAGPALDSYRPPFPGPDRATLTARLLAVVEEACRSRHPEATIRRHGAGPVPYLDVTGPRDGEWQRWPIGVSAEDLDTATVVAFHETVIEPVYLPLDEWVDSELVHTGAPPAEEVRREARRRRIRLRALAELEGRWDPRPYLERQARRLADDPVYPPELYVPQRFVVAAPDGAGVQSDVFRAMCDWLDVEEARFLLILGDFGRGKSFLLRELARRIPREVPHVVPMLIELRALEKTHSVDDLLALHLAKAEEHGVDVRAVRRMVEQGSVALLFDGFDELALRVTYDRAAEHLKTVLSAVTGRAKVVLTGRTQHFLTDSQHRTELGDLVRFGADSRELHLTDFDGDQIREFLVRLFRRRLGAQRSSTGAAQTAKTAQTAQTAPPRPPRPTRRPGPRRSAGPRSASS